MLSKYSSKKRRSPSKKRSVKRVSKKRSYKKRSVKRASKKRSYKKPSVKHSCTGCNRIRMKYACEICRCKAKCKRTGSCNPNYCTRKIYNAHSKKFQRTSVKRLFMKKGGAIALNATIFDDYGRIKDVKVKPNDINEIEIDERGDIFAFIDNDPEEYIIKPGQLNKNSVLPNLYVYKTHIEELIVDITKSKKLETVYINYYPLNRENTKAFNKIKTIYASADKMVLEELFPTYKISESKYVGTFKLTRRL